MQPAKKRPPATDDERKTQESGVDTCWHVPLISALAVLTVSIGSENSGFFYVGFMEVFRTNRAAAAWPSMIITLADDFAGLVIWILQRWFSIFNIAHIGCALAWIGMIASAFPPSMTWVTVTFGLIYGLGMGVTTTSLGIIIVMFFEKYRGIASGIKYAGYSLSSFLFSKILVLMEETFDFRGTILLCGAIMTHATLFTLLLEKPFWRKPRPIDHHGPTISNPLPANHNDKTLTIPGLSETSECDAPVKRRKAWKSLNLLRMPMFYVIVIYATAADYCKTLFQSTIVDHAMDRGCSLTESESLVLYYSVAQLVGRLTIPLISDLGFVKRSTFVTITVVLSGSTFLILPHVTSFPYLVAVCLLVATLVGCVSLMASVLMADYLGVDAIPLCWTATGLVNLPFYLCSPMIIGFFRDSMGAYDNFYRYLAGTQFLVGVMFCLVCVSENIRNITMKCNTKKSYNVNM